MQLLPQLTSPFLQNRKNIRGTRLEYADGSVGTEIKMKGNVVLNGHKVPAYVSPDLNQNLLSTPQIDKYLGGATIQYSSRSVTFIPDENQKQMLNEICGSVGNKNMIMDAKLNSDGLYAADTSYLSKSNVAVFPRIECATLAQAVYFLHCSLGHMPKSALLYLAKDGCGEGKMVSNWPTTITTEVINRNYPQCKACMEAQSKKAPFHRITTDKVDFHVKPRRTQYSGQMGQLDMWGPYPKGRQGYTHIFALIDAYSQYVVAYRCVNEPGELPRLTKRALEEFQSYGVMFKSIIGDSAYANESVISVINTAYGDNGGAIFAKAVPDEHETIGIVERFFQSSQRRGAACNLSFISHENANYKYFGLDAMMYGIITLNHTPRAKFGFKETPSSIIFHLPLDLGNTCVLPFGFPVIAHSKKLVSKLHGRGTECIYLRPSEGGLFRSGIFFNIATRKTITRRSFSPSNTVPFDLFIDKDGKRKLVEFEVEDEICDDHALNQPPNDEHEDCQVGSVSESNETIPDLVPDSDDEDDPLPEFTSDSDDEEEIDSQCHQWTDVSLSSLPPQQRKKFGYFIGQNFLERDKKTIVPFV